MTDRHTIERRTARFATVLGKIVEPNSVEHENVWQLRHVFLALLSKVQNKRNVSPHCASCLFFAGGLVNLQASFSDGRKRIAKYLGGHPSEY